jgi:hypothetical protein
MHAYNIVGDGTPQAFLPILTGKTEVELPLTRKRYKNANYVDVYPWIWNVRAPHVRAGHSVQDFKSAGYATQYGEDAGAIGTFTYRLKVQIMQRVPITVDAGLRQTANRPLFTHAVRRGRERRE